MFTVDWIRATLVLIGTEAQEPKPTEKVVETSPIIVTATREPDLELRVPAATSIVDQKRIERILPQRTPDALKEEVGVVIQETNQGGGSPIIRGRSGKDNLLLIDGQRFNSATYRRNHQYLNTIDLGTVERIEIVRGPTSVLYGSDAMGGTVNVITRRRALTGVPDFGARLYSQYESANEGLVSHIGVEGEVERFGFTAGFTWKDLGDLKAGSVGDPAGAVDIDGVQDPTGYREHDFGMSGIYEITDQDALDFLILYNRQYDVPRSDVLIANDKEPNPPDLKRNSDPQLLRWYELRYRHEDRSQVLESLEVTATLHSPKEGRQRIRVNSPTEEIVEKDEIYIPGLNAQAGIRYAPDHLLTTGFEGYYETVDSSRFTRDLTTGAITPDANGRYPDGSTYQSYGVFAQDQWDLSDTVHWTNGIRYSWYVVDADFDGLVVDGLPPFNKLSETYTDFTFATGLSVDVTEDTSVYGSISRGFRAPNLDDLAVLGDFAGGDRVPNFDLEPETVLNFEVGAKHRSRRLVTGGAVALAFYHDLLDNKFVFTDNGTDFFQVDNVGQATILSLEGWVEYVTIETDGANPEQSIFAQAFWNYGENHTDDEPVSKVPPPEAMLGYRFQGPKKEWSAEAFLRGAAEQDRLSAADEADPRFPEGGTPAWWTFNVRGGIDLLDNMRVSAGVENIFNYRYRVHGSGIDAPGRNFILSVDVRF